MRIKKITLLLLIVLFFQGCSWQEYFVVTNQTNSDIIIEYEIEQPKSGFGIFDNRISLYKTTNSGDIDWNEIKEITDLDTARYSIKIILAPNNALIIGTLSNDNYKSHDQYFINGRTFNLKKLAIKKEKTIIEISPTTFDNYFKKKKGIIGLRIKEN